MGVAISSPVNCATGSLGASVVVVVGGTVVKSTPPEIGILDINMKEQRKEDQLFSTFPNTIKALRLKFDWTQQQLADACDVSLRTIQRVEKEGAASKETTMSLCAVFEVRQGELIKLDDETPEQSTTHAVSKQNLAAIVAASSFVSFALGMATVFVIF